MCRHLIASNHGFLTPVSDRVGGNTGPVHFFSPLLSYEHDAISALAALGGSVAQNPHALPHTRGFA